MAALTQPAPAVWPRTSLCDRCHQPTLQARHQGAGRPATLDPQPVLPLGRCGECQGRGTIGIHEPRSTWSRTGIVEAGDLYNVRSKANITTPCPVCHGTGITGESLTSEHILLDSINGTCRRYDGDPAPWEAAHTRHHCR